MKRPGRSKRKMRALESLRARHSQAWVFQRAHNLGGSFANFIEALDEWESQHRFVDGEYQGERS